MTIETSQYGVEGNDSGGRKDIKDYKDSRDSKNTYLA
jgi:hypothetical protein